MQIDPAVLAILKGFGISLGLTLLLELFVAFLMKIRGWAEFLIVALVNILTNPVVVLLVYFMMYRFPAYRWPVEIALVSLSPVAFAYGWGWLFVLVCLAAGAGILTFAGLRGWLRKKAV